MLPGKAMSVPAPTRFLMRLAQKATPTPYQGPRNTAQSTFTMCWVGEHLLPKTGKLTKALPTTASATKMAAMASFLVLLLLIFDAPFQKSGGKSRRYAAFPREIQGRSRLTGLLSRRNTASHRTHIWPGRRALPLRPPPAKRRHAEIFPLAPPSDRMSKNKKAPKREPGRRKMTPSGGITRIRS